MTRALSSKSLYGWRHTRHSRVNIREAIALHLDGENLTEEGFAEDPTVIATLELPAVA